MNNLAGVKHPCTLDRRVCFLTSDGLDCSRVLCASAFPWIGCIRIRITPLHGASKFSAARWATKSCARTAAGKSISGMIRGYYAMIYICIHCIIKY